MDLTGARRHRGDVIAAVLAGSWRTDPPATTVGRDDLAEVVPLLVATGAAGLAWRTTKPRGDLLGVAEPLRDAWLLEVGRDRLREELVAAVAGAARAKGIDVLIYKGWAAARYYPGPGLRPSGDIDVIVEPADVPAAEEIAAVIPRLVLDIHSAPPPGLGTTRALLARADRVRVDGAAVSVPRPVDHVLMAAWHMFKHGAWRPLWLCDVAAMLERLPGEPPPADEPHRSYWSVATGLAATMLDARTEARHAPAWVRRTVAEEWGTLRYRAYGPLTASFRASPARALVELPGRIPNRLAGAVGLGLPIVARPELAAAYRLIGRRLRSSATAAKRSAVPPRHRATNSS